MFPKSRTVLTTLLAVGYLAQAVLLGVAHHHVAEHCAEGSHCTIGLQRDCIGHVRWQDDRAECGYGGQHSCAPIGKQHPPEPKRRPPHDQDNCSICHYLTAPTLSVPSGDFDQVSKVAAAVAADVPDLYSILPIRNSLPRGPPAGNS